MSAPEISESLASEILITFLTHSISVPDLAREIGIPIFTLLRWFESEPVVHALEQIETLHRLQQTIAASAAAPRAVGSLLRACEGEDSTPAAAGSAANAILRFAASTTRAARAKSVPPARQVPATSAPTPTASPVSGVPVYPISGPVPPSGMTCSQLALQTDCENLTASAPNHH